MGFFEDIKSIQKEKNSSLCLGLDPDYKDVNFRDNAQNIIDWAEKLIISTKDHICCIKPQWAFYFGLHNDVISEIVSISHHHNLPVILDHKFNDIGSTAKAYAYGSFEARDIDAVTVNAYMGSDSVLPFSEHKEKGVFVLACTSNPSSEELQYLELINGKPLYIKLVQEAMNWGDNIGFVVGATRPDAIEKIRKECNSWLLLPGLGAQGGDPVKSAMAAKENYIFPVSRGIANAENPEQAAKALKESVITAGNK